MNLMTLHTSIQDGIPYLWAEQGNEKHPEHAAGAYPYQPELKQLRASLKSLLPDFRMQQRDVEQKTIWLPSRGEQPIPSSALLAVPSLDLRRKIQLKPYTTLARALPLEALLELSRIAETDPRNHQGLVFGASLHWCARLLPLVINVVAREHYLPGVVDGGDGQHEARWLPVLDEQDEQALTQLTENMPAVCRCMADMEDAQPDQHPQQISNHMLMRLLDGLLRRSNQKRSSSTQPSIHDAWLSALVSQDATIKWTNSVALCSFTKELEQWQRPVDLMAKSPFKFCFRLSEPNEKEELWSVEYLLQPKQDPSLLVPLAALWRADAELTSQLKNFGSNAHEFVLTALGQASGLCAEITASLKHRHPDGYELDATGVCHFLQQQAEALRGAGFAVLLPSWWVGRGQQPIERLKLKARAKSPTMQSADGDLSLDSLINFDLEASLGGESLNLDALRRLAGLKTPLVRLRGQWIMIDQDEIQQALKYLQKQQQSSSSIRDLISMALGSEQQFGDFPVETVSTDGWLEQLLANLTGESEITMQPLPKKFEGTLRPYQERGFSWLAFLRRWRLGACLADDMGLGKTIQTLALLQRERETGESRPVLLICPTSVINNWRKEAERFTPELSVLVHHGPDRRRKAAFKKAAEKHALVLSSFGLLQRDFDFLQHIAWAGIILDEAQTIKNPESKQSKAARAIKADYRIALTGTPVENHVGDLWSLMDFLNPGLLGTQASFKRNFHRPIQVWQDAEVATQLKSLTSPFILRRMKTDKSIIHDLPDKIEQKAYCTLTREQASLYKAVVDDMQLRLEESEGMERRGLVLATLSKLKQVCNHPAQFLGDGTALPDRSGKLARLQEILEEVRELGERTLIFTQFTTMGGMIQDHFQQRYGEEVIFLHGGVSKKRRDQMVERFQQEAGPSIFVLSLKAGGTGLNLTRANHVVHFDRWWNPAVENQATDRAFRIGQQRNVQVHKFIVAGTLEERIDQMIERKTGVAAQVVGSGEQWLTEMNNDELHALIQLSKDAVGD